MSDYISREMAKAFFTPQKGVTFLTPIPVTVESLLAAIDNIPAADVRPVRRGKWVDMGDFISCSSCNATHLKEFESDYGKVMRLDVRTNFCPNCGADMREEN